MAVSCAAHFRAVQRSDERFRTKSNAATQYRPLPSFCAGRVPRTGRASLLPCSRASARRNMQVCGHTPLFRENLRRAPVAICKSAATHPLWMVQHRSGIAASAAASAGQSDAESEDSGAAGVVYLECAGDQRLSGFLRKHVETDASDLIHLGAVWVRKCKESKRGRKMLPWARRIEDGQIRKGSRVRVFTCPTRFPVAGRTDWAERVLYEDDAFLVMNRERCVARPKPQTPSSEPSCAS